MHTTGVYFFWRTKENRCPFQKREILKKKTEKKKQSMSYVWFFEGPVVRCKRPSQNALSKGEDKVEAPQPAEEMIELHAKQLTVCEKKKRVKGSQHRCLCKSWPTEK